MKLLGYTVILCLTFWGTAHCFPRHLQHLTFPAATLEGSDFSTSSSAFVVFRFLDYSHPSGCEVVSYRDFDLHFPTDLWCWTPFHVLVDCLCIFFGEMSVQSFAYFLIGCLSFCCWIVRVLYIFWLLDCYQIWFVKKCKKKKCKNFSNKLYAVFLFLLGQLSPWNELLWSI